MNRRGPRGGEMTMLLQERDILSDDDFARVSAAVRRHCGINLHEGKKELVRGRLLKRLRSGGFADASAYLSNVLADPRGEEFSNLIDFLAPISPASSASRHISSICKRLSYPSCWRARPTPVACGHGA